MRLESCPLADYLFRAPPPPQPEAVTGRDDPGCKYAPEGGSAQRPAEIDGQRSVVQNYFAIT
jgi:hypothetical protein